MKRKEKQQILKRKEKLFIFLVPQDYFTGLHENSPVLSTILASTKMFIGFSGQRWQHLSCEKMFSLQYVCLIELCPTALECDRRDGVWSKTLEPCHWVYHQEDGGELHWIGQAEHSSLLPAVNRVRCHWENCGMVVGSPEREEGRDKWCSQGTHVLPRKLLQCRFHVLFPLPPLGLLEGLPLCLSLPGSCVFTLESFWSILLT